jgi:endonuclease G
MGARTADTKEAPVAARRTAVAVSILLACVALLLLWGSARTAAAQPESAHLALGNPSGAVADAAQPANYLIVRPQYALGYSRDDGIPRWVSWRLVATDVLTVERYAGNFFRDTSLPDDWPQVIHADYTNSGYDRGHMVSSEDRTATVEDNRATFILTNVVPQSPQNNRGPWLDLESFGRQLAAAGDEVYNVAGPEGEIARLPAGSSKVRVPATTWKVVLAVPPGPGSPVERVTTATRLVAIRVPNGKDDTSVRQADDWELYRTTADALEALTGLDFFAALPPTVQRVLEARQDIGALPYTLTVSGTAALSATVRTAFAPLAVRVTSLADGAPVPGVTVTFAALGDVANANLGGVVVATATTDAEGVARVTAIAGPGAGSYTVEASLAGVFVPATFTLTNLEQAGAPANPVYLPLVVR